MPKTVSVGSFLRMLSPRRLVFFAVLASVCQATPSVAQQTAPATDPQLPTPTSKPIMPPSTATRRPDLFAPEPVYDRRDNFFFAGAADLRYRTRTSNQQERETIGTYIAASRFTADYVRANPKTGDERGGVRLQFLLENDNRGTALNRLRTSELYAYYRFLFPGVSASLRGGQFVLPFGLMAVYDTPLQPIQPLYERSLGLRVDTGVMLEGDYGPFHYAGAITFGAGPYRRDPDSNKVFSFRLERTIITKRLGRFQVGGSLLSGRLPVTEFNTELPASGKTDESNFVDKTRFAGDAQYFYGPFVVRGEIVFGGDGEEPVWGYFGEVNYRIAQSRAVAVVTSRRWNFPDKPQKATTIGLGMNYDMGGGFTLRSLFEFERDVPFPAGTNPEIIRRFSIQTRLNF